MVRKINFTQQQKSIHQPTNPTPTKINPKLKDTTKHNPTKDQAKGRPKEPQPNPRGSRSNNKSYWSQQNSGFYSPSKRESSYSGK